MRREVIDQKTLSVHDAMDPFHACRTVHSHLSSLSIPISSEKPPSTREADESPVATPHHSAKLWTMQQPGSLQIQRFRDAMDPFQVYRPVHSHLSSLSIPIGSENTTPLHGVADAL